MPIEGKATENDQEIHVRDERFRPTLEGQRVVEALVESGPPPE